MSKVELSLPTVRDPDAESLVRQIARLGQPALHELGVEGARSYLEGRAEAAAPGPEVDHVDDDAVGNVMVRVYRADARPDAPVVVYFHGGGWVIGSVSSSDPFCRKLSREAQCIVVSVDYPLAPEHPFPAAVDSAVDAIAWAAAQAAGWGGDASRLAVLGDSAGGNLATVAVRRLVEAGKDLVRRQILAYPGTNAERTTGAHFGHEWPLLDDDRAWFLDHYLVDEAMRRDPDVAPLFADVTGMPPTTMLLGGCDPLFEEGMAYADRLWSAGVSVDLHVFSGQIHGFLTLDEAFLPRSREALGLVANAIRST